MSSSDSMQTWIQWYCSLRGNELLCEVDEDYISDNFNLTGLTEIVPNMRSAIDKILDLDTDVSEAADDYELEKQAEILYGLIHARFILTNRGLNAMLRKMLRKDFGTCPRALCDNYPLLPVGLDDTPANDTVKMFCAQCDDVYQPRLNRHHEMDGAYFGTSFPEMLLMVHPEHRPRICRKFEPKLFGFRIHPSVGPKDTQ